jgi:ZIP family zinc transporter
VGCGVFFGGDWLIGRAGGEHRKSPSGEHQDDPPLAIVLGTVLDGIPEAIAIGLTVYGTGAIGAAFLASVCISNVPEALSSTSGLVARGWKRPWILGTWTLVALVSGVSSLVGYAAFKHISPDVVAFVLAFAGGAILTMLADTMMPEAYRHAGKLVGVVTTLGFHSLPGRPTRLTRSESDGASAASRDRSSAVTVWATDARQRPARCRTAASIVGRRLGKQERWATWNHGDAL